ncbi:unnamed protein product [Soboliphyme baturini]|uniref:DUF1534 domain-containing protein n=1 Tax=Soboliphyme baturini TaxID=241478 RepID=A0A183J997_9BILA|nr:unnamed protein product [Soboliphyme baturini]
MPATRRAAVFFLDAVQTRRARTAVSRKPNEHQRRRGDDCVILASSET